MKRSDIPIDPTVEKTIAAIEHHSRGKLRRISDLTFLLHMAATTKRMKEFDRLSFLAKFASRTYRIMERIGKSGEGYEKLSAEFSTAVEEMKSIMQMLIAGAPADRQAGFAAGVFDLTPDAFGNLLDLLSDLAWYKNYTIDHPGTSG
jgi:hypothetical protein